MADSPLKRCRCGRQYVDWSDWRKLPFVGYQPTDAADFVLEMRQCACQSSLVIPLPEAARVLAG